MSDFCKRKRVRLGLGGGECVCHWNVVVNVRVTGMVFEPLECGGQSNTCDIIIITNHVDSI